MDRIVNRIFLLFAAFSIHMLLFTEGGIFCPLKADKSRGVRPMGKTDKISLTSMLNACFYPFFPPVNLHII
jgi:hypothetical protein